MTLGWNAPQGIEPRKYNCAHCNSISGSNRGYNSGQGGIGIYICTFCGKPTYFEGDRQIPGVAFGAVIENVPENTERLYNEARECVAVSSYTACVMVCRKILMHIAVEEDAEEGKSFNEYVQYLAKKGFVPPKGTGWVDKIRTKGNEANHEISIMSKDDAIELISFVEMLLKYNYEFPARIQPDKPESGE